MLTVVAEPVTGQGTDGRGRHGAGQGGQVVVAPARTGDEQLVDVGVGADEKDVLTVGAVGVQGGRADPDVEAPWRDHHDATRPGLVSYVIAFLPGPGERLDCGRVFEGRSAICCATYPGIRNGSLEGRRNRL